MRFFFLSSGQTSISDYEAVKRFLRLLAEGTDNNLIISI